MTRRVRGVIVVYDVLCASCSRIARELPDVVRVPVTVRSCRDPRLAELHPTLPVAVRTCTTPAVGTVRRDGSVRWWPGRSGAIGLLPVVRPRGLLAALDLLWTAVRAARTR